MASGRFHWSNCAPPACFVKINAIAALPWLALLLFPGLTTLYVALTVTAVLVYLEIFKKLTPMAGLRTLSIMLTGRVKATSNLVREMSR